MKRTVNNKHALKLSLLLTTVVALSLWAGNLVLSPDRQKPSNPITTSSTTPTNSPPRSNTQQSQPQVYWLRLRSTHATRTKQNKLTLVAKSLPNTTNSDSPQQILTTAMQKLLAAAPTDDLSSTIPQGTKLRSLQVRADGVHVDLSKEFRSGGGSTSMIYRVAQVIYTASSLDPDAKVFVSVEGKPIDEKHPLGGEGLILRQPTTRSQFATDFSIAP
jgi:spore germination protein GerM